MTFQDERNEGGRSDQRIEHLAEWLEVTLGPRLVAYAIGVTPSEVCRYAQGAEPGAEVEARLRNLYTATWFIASTDGPGSAHDWLMEPNPTLENRTPADLLRGGESPAPAWFSVARVY
jgi:Antitoxin Xre/MbcA/ParS C-terminal toxin-binding domain